MPAQHPAEVLRTLLDASPDAIIALDSGGLVRLWNHGAERILGWTENEMRGQPMPLDLQLHSASDREIQMRAYAKDGRVVDLAVRGAPWCATEGDSQGTLAILSDVTARLKVERDLVAITEREERARSDAQAERRFRDLLEAAPDAIIEVNRDGRIVLLNRVTEALFGYPREELLGKPVEFLIPEELRTMHVHHRAD